MISLSPRLALIERFIKGLHSNIIADVGCDHGLLSLSLLGSGAVKHAYLMDIGKGPLKKAEENAEKYASPGETDIILSDGLKELPGYLRNKGKDTDLPDTVIISGMGGPLILDIILSAPDIVKDSVKHWILSPQSEIYEFRRDIGKTGLKIADEDIAEDRDKFYFVMDAVRGMDGGSVSEDEASFLYGRPNIMKKSNAFIKLVNRDILIREGLLSGNNLPPERRKKIERELDIMRRVL